MIRTIVLMLIVGAFALTPVYLLNRYVLPELAAIKDSYGKAEAMVENATSNLAPTFSK